MTGNLFILLTLLFNVSDIEYGPSLPAVAKQAWEEYCQRSVRICGERTGTVAVNGKIRNTNSETYKFGNSNSVIYSIKSASPTNKFADNVYIVNAIYGFQLSMNKKNNKLVPSEIRKIDESGYLITPLKIDPRFSSRNYLQNIICILPLSDLNLRNIDNDYVILDSKLSYVNGKVEYEANLKNRKDQVDVAKERPMLHFKATFDSSNSWRIEKYSYIRQYNNDVKEYSNGEISYTTLPSSLFVPIELKHVTYYSNDLNMKIEMLDKFKLREEVPAPETDFTLSAFGFPEPAWITDKASLNLPWHFVFSIVGIFLLLLALYILFRRGKKAIA